MKKLNLKLYNSRVQSYSKKRLALKSESIFGKSLQYLQFSIIINKAKTLKRRYSLVRLVKLSQVNYPTRLVFRTGRVANRLASRGEKGIKSIANNSLKD